MIHLENKGKTSLLQVHTDEKMYANTISSLHMMRVFFSFVLCLLTHGIFGQCKTASIRLQNSPEYKYSFQKEKISCHVLESGKKEVITLPATSKGDHCILKLFCAEGDSLFQYQISEILNGKESVLYERIAPSDNGMYFTPTADNRTLQVHIANTSTGTIHVALGFAYSPNHVHTGIEKNLVQRLSNQMDRDLKKSGLPGKRIYKSGLIRMGEDMRHTFEIPLTDTSMEYRIAFPNSYALEGTEIKITDWQNSSYYLPADSAGSVPYFTYKPSEPCMLSVEIDRYSDSCIRKTALNRSADFIRCAVIAKSKPKKTLFKDHFSLLLADGFSNSHLVNWTSNRLDANVKQFPSDKIWELEQAFTSKQGASVDAPYANSEFEPMPSSKKAASVFERLSQHFKLDTCMNLYALNGLVFHDSWFFDFRGQFIKRTDSVSFILDDYVSRAYISDWSIRPKPLLNNELIYWGQVEYNVFLPLHDQADRDTLLQKYWRYTQDHPEKLCSLTDPSRFDPRMMATALHAISPEKSPAVHSEKAVSVHKGLFSTQSFSATHIVAIRFLENWYMDVETGMPYKQVIATMPWFHSLEKGFFPAPWIFRH